MLQILLALLALIAPARGQGISYTVQVVALSDQEAALGVQRALLEDSYPAYVVRAALAQGDVYRVRVGAFANRLAALTYSEAMPEVAGGQPLPALAEGIPPGVMPLQPRVLFAVPGSSATLLDWNGGIALRIQDDRRRQASYYVVHGGTPLQFEAWRAAPSEGRIVRVTDLPLWPADWQEQPPEAREAYERTLLDSLAVRLGVPSEEFLAWRQESAEGVPYLIIAEQMDISGLSSGEVLAVAAAPEGPSDHGPVEWAFGEAEFEEPPVLFQVDPTSSPPATAVGGEDWQVMPDAPFFLLSLEGGTPWRAGVGTPLWSDGNFLLSRVGDQLLLYDFLAH